MCGGLKKKGGMSYGQGASELYLWCAVGKGSLLKIPHFCQVFKWVPALLGSKPATDWHHVLVVMHGSALPVRLMLE